MFITVLFIIEELESQTSLLGSKLIKPKKEKFKNSRDVEVILMEKAVVPHSSTLAGKIPWMEEPGGLPSMGSNRVGHN